MKNSKKRSILKKIPVIALVMCMFICFCGSIVFIGCSKNDTSSDKLDYYDNSDNLYVDVVANDGFSFDINFVTKENTTLVPRGRHDPCIVPRARVVADSMIALTLCDILAQRYGTDWLGDRK